MTDQDALTDLLYCLRDYCAQHGLSFGDAVEASFTRLMRTSR